MERLLRIERAARVRAEQVARRAKAALATADISRLATEREAAQEATALYLSVPSKPLPKAGAIPPPTPPPATTAPAPPPPSTTAPTLSTPTAAPSLSAAVGLISESDLVVGGDIAEGQFALVVRATLWGQRVAVKQLKVMRRALHRGLGRALHRPLHRALCTVHCALCRELCLPSIAIPTHPSARASTHPPTCPPIQSCIHPSTTHHPCHFRRATTRTAPRSWLS